MKNPDVISHWYTLMENFETSGMEFHASVEQALKERNVPDIELLRVEWQEGGMGTARREYLRVKRSRLAFDICAAPFGKGFFFSWWLARIPQKFGALLLGLVLLGLLIVWSILIQALGFFLGTILIPVLVGALGILIRDGTRGIGTRFSGWSPGRTRRLLREGANGPEERICGDRSRPRGAFGGAYRSLHAKRAVRASETADNGQSSRRSGRNSAESGPGHLVLQRRGVREWLGALGGHLQVLENAADAGATEDEGDDLH